MSTTLKDIAGQLGLSVSTVSRVVNGKGFVSEETRRRIIETARALNYHPNEYARSLRTQKYRSIGVIVPNVTNPYYNSMLQSIEEKCRVEDYSVLIGVSNYDRDRAHHYSSVMISNHAAGLILASRDNSTDYAEAAQNGLVVVSVNEHDPSEGIDFVSIDNQTAMSDLTQYIINLGHRRIACLYGSRDQDNCTTRRRYQGFLDGMARNGLPVDPRLTIDSGLNYERGYRAAEQLLFLEQMPSAILCHNNSIAVGAYCALTKAGYRIPEDISIACFDAIVPNNVIARKFTCILQPIEQIGCEAVDIIIQKQTADEPAVGYEQRMVPHKLIIGDTTKANRI